MRRDDEGGRSPPLWIVGHEAAIEGGIPQVLFGEKNPVEHRKSLFAPGTRSTTDASDFAAFDEVLSTVGDLRAINLMLLDDIGDAGLDRGLATRAPLDGL